MMSNGVSPLSRVFLNNHAINSATTIPSRYIDSMVRPLSLINPSTVTFGTHAAMSNAYTGKRAEQLISGATRIVTSRSLGLSIVRVAMMPGMAQANELSIGIKLLPCNPTLLINLSIKNADEEEKQQDLRQEHDHRANSCNHAVHQQTVQIASRNQTRDRAAEPVYPHLERVHWDAREREYTL